MRPGTPVRLAGVDPDASEGYERKQDVAEELDRQRQRIQDLQARLYAERRRSLLVVLQAMDTGGKDGAVKHVFRGADPQGCQVWSFKSPTHEELAHDFLWRIHHRVPAKGMTGIFNMSLRGVPGLQAREESRFRSGASCSSSLLPLYFVSGFAARLKAPGDGEPL